MLMLISLGMALSGSGVTPVVMMIVVLALSHLLNRCCGTPGDSGGCETVR